MPENAEVANAIGALRADIDAVVRVEITKIVMASGDTYYIVHTPAGSRKYDILDDALSNAKAASEEAALKEARARGALGQLAVSTNIKKNFASNGRGGNIDLGYTSVSEVTVRFGEEQ